MEDVEAPLSWPRPLPSAAAWLRSGTTLASAQVRKFVDSHPDQLGHLAWYAAFVEAYKQAELPHLGDIAYLDYAGAALYSRAQLQAASASLLEGFLANPHTSEASAAVIERAREGVLGLYGVSSATHTLIFTSGATQALQLVGENFAWSRSSLFLYATDNHTSVLGLRQYARRAGAACGIFGIRDLGSLRSGLDKAVPLTDGGNAGAPSSAALTEKAASADGPAASWQRSNPRDMGPNLIAFPGESNFSGARSDMSYVSELRSGALRWRVLLDAAKLATSPGALDLSSCPADFAVLSFYKIFGYPTGLGALIVRHDAAPLLAPSWSTSNGSGPQGAFGQSYFAGGCVASVSATSSFAVPRPALTEWLERGTAHFLGVAALPSQIACAAALGPPSSRRNHTLSVCREAFLHMSQLRHQTGARLCKVLGRHAEHDWWRVQGPTIAATFYFADGSAMPYGLVAALAHKRGILLRTGCHCNAGACMEVLGLRDEDIRHFYASGKVCGDDLGVIDGKHTGVVRVSFGTYSTLQDVRRWVCLLQEELVDRNPSEDDHKMCMIGTPSLPNEPIASQSVGAAPLAMPQGDAAGRVVAVKIYPIKGCGPLRVRRWPLDPSTGALFLDRRWCVAVEGRGSRAQRLRPLSAKQAPRLTQVRLGLRRRSGGMLSLVLSCKVASSEVELPLSASDAAVLLGCRAEVEGDAGYGTNDATASVGAGDANCADGAQHPGSGDGDIGRWFAELLKLPQARFMEAAVGEAKAEEVAGNTLARQSHFANAPSTLLLVSSASLREFGRLCGLAVPAERFRANLEVDFAEPFVEAAWPDAHPLRIGDAPFEAAGRCVRCQAIDVDPEDAASTGPSLLAALATAQPGGGGGKGPTFGTLLRRRGASDAPQIAESFQILEVGMIVEHTSARCAM
eukprot:CAMPEP_0176012050 /NCGR_PEP_ID=MMETSP0120_2-20121206/5595_1 /TAXON_ID=160619 /ORGANISM="Kryptoperidinium foliaceum, Strain CCMP 1326" /LENGTH=910 /DNA_ID=CAMNT_0017344923 /DNA_START=1 /DNA_END=2733 /DNA_ORIENTATION=+